MDSSIFDSDEYRRLCAWMDHPSEHSIASNPYRPVASPSVYSAPSSGHPSPLVSGSPAVSARGMSPASGLAGPVPATVSAACLACRAKHLKCDGQSPCSRCQGVQTECIYVASRRGYKGPRRGAAISPSKRHASGSPPSPSPNEPAQAVPPRLAEASAQLPFSAPSASNNLHICRAVPGGPDFLLSHYHPAQLPVPSHSHSQPQPQSLVDRCLDSFYQNFHAAHPFALPKPHLVRYAKQGGLDHLLAAIRWIGSLHLDVEPLRDSLFEEAYRLAYVPGRVPDAFLVQSLLLLMLGLDGDSQQEKARMILADVEEMAVRMALHTRPFATLHGRGDAVLEESWRRTWWGLFVADTMVAGVHRTPTSFSLLDVPADVALPCEEHQYLSGRIPQPPTHLHDIDDRDFSPHSREFSSFAFLIVAARNLGKFMRMPPPALGPDDEHLARIETLLANWRLHLPESKRNALRKNGRLDEMMFQGHMVTHATSILLHQPFSQLDTSPAQDVVNSCTPYRGGAISSDDSFATHTRHTITSANEISKLITHRVPLTSHTHFFACVLTLSSIVHLSKWAFSFVHQDDDDDDDDLRQLIRLNMGALAAMAKVWRSAHKAAAQVRGAAHEIYAAKKAHQLASPPNYWLDMTQDEITSAVSTDEDIINDMDAEMMGFS